MLDQLSNIQKIRDLLIELSKSDSLPHYDDMKDCKDLIKDYFINIKPFLKNQ